MTLRVGSSCPWRWPGVQGQLENAANVLVRTLQPGDSGN